MTLSQGAALHGVEVEQALLAEAADWAITLHHGEAGPAQREQFERWCGQSAAHRAAWERVSQVLGRFEPARSGLGRGTIHSLKSMERRRAVRVLTGLALAVPAGWVAMRSLPWAQWQSDVSSATGERRELALPDGSLLMLNTASAVDIRFTEHERLVVLRAGEIMVTTHADPSPVARPFLVDTPQGTVKALGTRFSVRLFETHARVAVFEHAVEITPSQGQPVRWQAGQAGVFDAQGATAATALEPETADAWTRGVLVVHDMRLADVVDELARYRRGVLRCDPDIADLRMSGALSIADTDAGLLALSRTLPVRIARLGPYWVTVRPR